ncbi:MAG TPA: alpha/beta hydrolase [Steroidobacteraceae bacterium]|nr:alpha/beta hydrolase [Steroidobacteraceae bacterium]
MANMIRFAATGFAAALRFAVLGSFVLAGTLGAVDTAAADDGDSRGPLTLREQGNFFVGGAHNANDQIVGQMYVEYWIPQHQEHPFPIILVHGGGQIGAGWSQTPDGREGWVQFFARRGFAVYVVDQAARGRSPYNSQLGPLGDPANSVRAQSLWAAIERFMLWPAARFHTQWVGPAVDGDPTFEQFLSSQAQAMTNAALQEELTAEGLVALVDKIGPSILVPHSQPGSAAWLVADRRPELLKAIVTIEPGGPPVFRDEPHLGFPPSATFPWGLTRNPITYDPPVASASQLSFVALPKDPDVSTCYVQTAPARKLPNVAKVPILYLSSPSGYNTAWDPCTTKYLTQAGVRYDWVHLQDIGIEGNGHFMFIEKNSDQVAGVVLDWIKRLERDR